MADWTREQLKMVMLLSEVYQKMTETELEAEMDRIIQSAQKRQHTENLTGNNRAK